MLIFVKKLINNLFHKTSVLSNKYGYIRDLADHRDSLYKNPQEVMLPSYVDMRPFMPPVYDQLMLGSCVGNAIAAAIEFSRRKQGLLDFVPSRLFIYYNSRKIEKTIPVDSGVQIRDGIKAVVREGACLEIEWPYIPKAYAIKPSKICYTDAKKDIVSKYSRVPQDILSIQSALAAGYPIVVGMSIYESFENYVANTTGHINLPIPGEKLLGGHAVLVVGYDDKTRRYIVRNSWGSKWGDRGYFTIPYEYLLDKNLSSDFWIIKTVSKN